MYPPTKIEYSFNESNVASKIREVHETSKQNKKHQRVTPYIVLLSDHSSNNDENIVSQNWCIYFRRKNMP